MKPEIEIQIESRAAALPSRQELRLWATSVLQSHCQLNAPILTVRLVDEPEGRQLNQQWRGKSLATNVLSFPLDVPPDVELDCLGDIVLCVPVIETEAKAQQKSQDAHWAHLVIHGVLHLLGYDHQDFEQAEDMEAIEVATLAQLGYPNPYT